MTQINLDDLITITIMIDNIYQPGDLIIITTIIELGVGLLLFLSYQYGNH